MTASRLWIVSYLFICLEYECELSSTAAETTTPPSTPPRPTGQALSTTPRRAETSPSKRRHVADPHDLEIVKKIRQNEVELHDRNTVLRGIKPNVSFCFLTSCFVIQDGPSR